LRVPARHLRDLHHVLELAEASYSLRHADARESCRLARLSVRRSEDLPACADSLDARAFAWAHLGNALRIANRLRESEEAIAIAYQFLEVGSGEAPLRARVLEFWAAALEDLRRFPEAEAALAEVLAIRRAIGDLHGLAVNLVQLANVVGHRGDPAGAVALLHEALGLIPAIGDRRLAEIALNNQAWFLIDDGRLDAAHSIVLELLHVSKEVEPLMALRRRWLVARVSAGFGCYDVAIAELADVRDAFVAVDQPYDAAFAALELALICANRGDHARQENVLLGVVTIFAALGIGRESMAALLLQEALRYAAAAKEVVPRVIRALRLEPRNRAPRGTGD
jgi:tetratricopeptide (TPR) repeat protein